MYEKPNFEVITKDILSKEMNSQYMNACFEEYCQPWLGYWVK